MCFDTTSSNTGRNNGACVIIEQLIGRDLLYFGCRHHILELVAGAVFSEVLGASSGPEIIMFKIFKAKWCSLDQTNYENNSTDKIMDS